MSLAIGAKFIMYKDVHKQKCSGENHCIFVIYVLMYGEISVLKYTDIDYINRKTKIQRQLGIK